MRSSVVTFNSLSLPASSTHEVRSVRPGGGLLTFNLAQHAMNVTDRGNLTQVEVVRHETNQQITTNLNYGFLLLP